MLCCYRTGGKGHTKSSAVSDRNSTVYAKVKKSHSNML